MSTAAMKHVLLVAALIAPTPQTARATEREDAQAQTVISKVPAAEDNSLGFDVELSFSPNALKELSERGERIVVSVDYYGYPKPSAEQHADEVGRILLGRENLEVPARPGTVHVTGTSVDSGRLDWIEGEVMVNGNVFSARRSDPNNLIECDFIDGKLADIVPAPVALHCALIEENPETKSKP